MNPVQTIDCNFDDRTQHSLRIMYSKSVLVPSIRTRNPRCPMADLAAWNVIRILLVALISNVCLPRLPHSLK